MKTTTTGTNFQSVPLIIKHDWEPTIARMKKLIMLKDHAAVEPYGTADHYLMKSLGTLSDYWDSESWYRFSGLAINQTMPWINDLLKSMACLEPDDGALSFLTGDGGGHIDLPNAPSALNYIFYSTDPDANTWFLSDTVNECHPSTEGSAWIINTQTRHGIKNTGTRYSLSIHFKADYQTLKNWFADKTQQDLTFG